MNAEFDEVDADTWLWLARGYAGKLQARHVFDGPVGGTWCMIDKTLGSIPESIVCKSENGSGRMFVRRSAFGPMFDKQVP